MRPCSKSEGCVQALNTTVSAKERRLQRQILRLREMGYSVRDLQRVYSVSTGVIHRLTKGKFPKSQQIRCKLGLQTLPFKKRIEGHQDKDSILAIYEFLRDRDFGQIRSNQGTLFNEQ